MLIVLFVTPLNVTLVNAKNVHLHRWCENFCYFFLNNLVLRTRQQSLVKRALAFSQPVAASTVSHPGA